MTRYRAIQGMNDVLPDDMARWHFVENAFAKTMALHGFREVRTPYLESTSLFVRAMGETTDVVEKEMYSFSHHNEELTLRPEGTAGAARAYVEHKVFNNEPVTRWYYTGPMFRGERPARGRYRQFYQAGAEIFGDAGPACDAELIDLLVNFIRQLGVQDIEVLVNSLGSGGARERYKEALVAHLTPKMASLSADSQRRLGTNALRILDSKDPRDKEAVATAPTLTEFLDDADKAHFDGLQRYLTALGTPFRIDPRLVRGLDYYTRTLFEIKGAKAKLGAGDTLVGGGRYDTMISDLTREDGKPQLIPAIGFAAGLERLLIASEPKVTGSVVDVYIAPLGEGAIAHSLALGKEIREAGVRCEVDGRGASLKSQLRRANSLGASFALIVGENEIANGMIQLKHLSGHTQESVRRGEVTSLLADRLRTTPPQHVQTGETTQTVQLVQEKA